MKMQDRWKIFAVLYRPTPLLRHFVRHYAALGFTDLYLIVSAACQDIDWAEVRVGAAPATIHLEPLYDGVFANGRDTAYLNWLRARHVGDCREWSAIVDVDEFYEFPLPLRELAAEAGEANCVQGFFVDRLAADGSLPEVRDDLPIGEQFPIETRATQRIIGGYDRKVMLARGFDNLSSGHHHLPDERLFPRNGRVLHYKWNAAVLAHLRERLEQREQTGYRWPHEVERFLDYWEKNGRMVLVDCV